MILQRCSLTQQHISAFGACVVFRYLLSGAQVCSSLSSLLILSSAYNILGSSSWQLYGSLRSTNLTLECGTLQQPSTFGLSKALKFFVGYGFHRHLIGFVMH